MNRTRKVRRRGPHLAAFLLLSLFSLLLTPADSQCADLKAPPERCGDAGCHEPLLSAGVVHQPVADENCNLCHPPAKEYRAGSHDPHGASRASLLLKAYPAPLYTRYGNDKYALCWDCHDQALAADKFTVSATGFRRGKRNFHYSHLHKGKGMTCRACHAVHASGQPFIMRSDSPAGVMSWNGKQVFQSLPEGGRCSGGCHTDVSYSR